MILHRGDTIPLAHRPKAAAVLIEEAQLVLRLGVPLLSGTTIIRQGIRGIADDALSECIELTKPILRFAISRRRSFGPRGKSRRVVLFFVSFERFSYRRVGVWPAYPFRGSRARRR